jgi:hypothetical protein
MKGSDVSYNEYQLINQFIVRNFWVFRTLDIILLVIALPIIVMQIGMIGFLFTIPIVIFSYYTSKKHDYHMAYLSKNDPCHAVWVGDSYFFNSMRVEDGYFNNSRIYEDKKGLYLFRENNMVGTTDDPNLGDKEYLRLHVQNEYKKYKKDLTCN